MSITEHMSNGKATATPSGILGKVRELAAARGFTGGRFTTGHYRLAADEARGEKGELPVGEAVRQIRELGAVQVDPSDEHVWVMPESRVSSADGSVSGSRADSTSEGEARVRHLLSGWGLGEGTIDDIVAFLRRYGPVGPGHLMSRAGADRINRAWSGEGLAADGKAFVAGPIRTLGAGQRVRDRTSGREMQVEAQTGGGLLCGWTADDGFHVGSVFDPAELELADEVIGAPTFVVGDRVNIGIYNHRATGVVKAINDDGTILTDVPGWPHGVVTPASEARLVTGEPDNLDRLEAELSGAMDREADGTIAFVLDNLARSLKIDRIIAIIRLDGRDMVFGGGEGTDCYADALEWACMVLQGACAASKPQSATSADEPAKGQPEPLPEGRGEMGNVGDKVEPTGKVTQSGPVTIFADLRDFLVASAPETLKAWDELQKALARPSPFPGGFPLRPGDHRPAPYGQAESPCSHAAILPDSGAEICPACGERVAEDIEAVKARLGKQGEDQASDDWSTGKGDKGSYFAHTWSKGKHGRWVQAVAPTEDAAIRALDAKLRDQPKPQACPPSVGRLRRVLLTRDEVAEFKGATPSKIAELLADIGLPGDTIGLADAVFDEGRSCYVQRVESKEWPEVLLGNEVPWHPRHGR